MKVKSKKGFELSLNMIIIVVIALVFLVAAIGLIRGWFKIIEDEVPKLIPTPDAIWPPTPDNPVALVPAKMDIKRGNSESTSLEIYNYVTSDIMCTLQITPTGQDSDGGIKFVYAKTNRPIDIGMVGHWDVNVKPGKSTPPDLYMFTIFVDCGEFSKQVDLTISVQ